MCFVCEVMLSLGSLMPSMIKSMCLAEIMMPFIDKITTSENRFICFSSKVCTDRMHLNSATNRGIWRLICHENLPLARLREREGPAAKRWEGEGARSI